MLFRSGAVHGGVVASLVDRAGAYEVVRSAGGTVVTSSVALSYLAAAKVGPLRAVARTLRLGRQQGVAEVHVYDVGRNDLLVATALITLSLLPGGGAAPPGGASTGIPASS